jgi:hypothetical protein
MPHYAAQAGLELEIFLLTLLRITDDHCSTQKAVPIFFHDVYYSCSHSLGAKPSQHSQERHPGKKAWG